MPAKSKAQFRFMQAAKSGKLKGKDGPSPEVAEEFISKTKNPKALPEKAKSKAKKARKKS